MKKSWLATGLALLGLAGVNFSSANALEFGDFIGQIEPPMAVDQTDPCQTVYNKLDTFRERPSGDYIEIDARLELTEGTCRLIADSSRNFTRPRDAVFEGYATAENTDLLSFETNYVGFQFEYDIPDASEFNDYEYYNIAIIDRFGFRSRDRVYFSNLEYTPPSDEGEEVSDCSSPLGGPGCLNDLTVDPDLLTVREDEGETVICHFVPGCNGDPDYLWRAPSCEGGDGGECTDIMIEVTDPSICDVTYGVTYEDGTCAWTEDFCALSGCYEDSPRDLELCRELDCDIVIPPGVIGRGPFPLDDRLDQRLQIRGGCQLNPSAAPQGFYLGWLALFGLALAGLRTKWKSNE